MNTDTARRSATSTWRSRTASDVGIMMSKTSSWFSKLKSKTSTSLNLVIPKRNQSQSLIEAHRNDASLNMSSSSDEENAYTFPSRFSSSCKTPAPVNDVGSTAPWWKKGGIEYKGKIKHTICVSFFTTDSPDTECTDSDYIYLCKNDVDCTVRRQIIVNTLD